MNANSSVSTSQAQDSKLANHGVSSRADFVRFLQAMAEEFRERPAYWENTNLASYLDAMAAWADDMEGFYKTQGQAPPEQPTWKLLADLLLAARVYE
jgi:hypothetical protein